jgi:Family of unknown function (DUF6529)
LGKTVVVEGLIETITFGNPTAVKVVLASIVAALAAYQVFLMAIGYGKIRPPFLGSKAASFAHRAIGDATVAVTLTITAMCIGYFGFEDASGEDTRATLHITFALLLLAAISLKIIVVRWWHSAGRFLPAFGITIFVLFVMTWLTSAGDYLWS